MENIYSNFKVFVSSPGDVIDERKIVEEVMDNINSTISDSLKTILSVITWERLPPETEEVRIQERLNRLIKECHFFILILHKRYGTVENGFSKSNTEREIDTILDSISRNGKKIIISYFKKSGNNSDPGRQEKKVIELKKKLTNQGLFYKEYENQNDFKDFLTHDLYKILIRLQLSTFKNECLKKFWRFGKIESQDYPRTYLIYPPVPRELMAGYEEKEFWLHRLASNVFFEDYKAIHKIKKSLSLIGFRNYQVYTKFSIPPAYSSSNVIWLCLPRLETALESLKKYNNRRFNLFPRKGNTPPYLIWKDNNGNDILIKSPLNQYLSLQRKNMDTGNDWNANLGKVFAKDFAIIGRFNNLESSEFAVNDNLKEFFIAGIRGLGTWGATWYIDRCYKAFNTLEDNDFQVLLEISYYNEAIVKVQDVSNETEDYFKNELTSSVIKSNILKYK